MTAPDTATLSPERPGAGFGLRLALWYAVVFVVSSLAIVLLTYALLAASLAERDRQIVVSTLREYSAHYARGGLAAIARAVDLEQRSGRRERLFVRVVRGGSWDDDPEGLRSAARFVSTPDWKIQDPQIPQSIWYLTDALHVGFRVVRIPNPPNEAECQKLQLEPVAEDLIKK